MSHVLVTGATGFVGRRLVPFLVEEGHRVRAMTRRPEEYDGPGEPVLGDVEDPSTLPEALSGIDVAVYLVHSLDSGDFERKDAEAARSFGLAAAATGVRQIVYLGGLGAEDGDLSAHLRSRREVESLLGEGGVPVTALRAAVVVGAGGTSWELTRKLVENLPALVVPRLASTRTQPIGVDDVISYLAGVIDNDEALGRVLEIGGADRLSYREMLEQAAEVMFGDRMPVVQTPLPAPLLSSYWLSLLTGVDATTGRNLLASMGTEVLVTDESVRKIVPLEPMTYAEAVRRAVEESRTD